MLLLRVMSHAAVWLATRGWYLSGRGLLNYFSERGRKNMGGAHSFRLFLWWCMVHGALCYSSFCLFLVHSALRSPFCSCFMSNSAQNMVLRVCSCTQGIYMNVSSYISYTYFKKKTESLRVYIYIIRAFSALWLVSEKFCAKHGALSLCLSTLESGEMCTRVYSCLLREKKPRVLACTKPPCQIIVTVYE